MAHMFVSVKLPRTLRPPAKTARRSTRRMRPIYPTNEEVLTVSEGLISNEPETVRAGSGRCESPRIDDCPTDRRGRHGVAASNRGGGSRPTLQVCLPHDQRQMRMLDGITVKGTADG
jgi:hypothetical protein